MLRTWMRNAPALSGGASATQGNYTTLHATRAYIYVCILNMCLYITLSYTTIHIAIIVIITTRDPPALSGGAGAIYIYIYIYTCSLSLYIYTHTHIHIYIYTYTYRYICMYIYIYIYIHNILRRGGIPTPHLRKMRPEVQDPEIPDLVYIYIYICVYMCVCIYIYIYTHIYTLLIILIIIVHMSGGTKRATSVSVPRLRLQSSEGKFTISLKSSSYAGASAGAEVARLRKWHAWCLLEHTSVEAY